MAETNSETVVDDDKEVTEQDLRDLKYGTDGVEDSNESDETDGTEETDDTDAEAGDDDGQTDDDATDDESEDDSTDDSTDDTSDFVKEFPNIKGDTPEEYAKNLEAAYKNSTAEFQRLRSEATTDDSDDSDTTATVDTSDPISLYMKQKMDDEIQTAFTDFGKDYTQVNDQTEYNKFTVKVAALSQTILQTEKRLASPTELYKMAAVILGWEPQSKPNGKEKLSMALKDKAASSKSSSSNGKTVPKSKVTDAMIKVNRMMYPGKSDDDIRKELEPYVNP